MAEFHYKCNAEITLTNSEGTIIGKKKCLNKFSTGTETDQCPKCLGKELTLIPVSFLKLWDTEREVRYYLTETMDIRQGLTSEEIQVARQIINRYCGEKAEQPEYSI